MSLNTENILRRFLIPLDLNGEYNEAIQMIKCLAGPLEQHIEKITLMHVTGGHYLSQHMSNVDVRAGHMIASDKFREIRDAYINSSVMPVMEKVKTDLNNSGVKTEIDIVVRDGDPVKAIVNEVEKGNFSSLLLQRTIQSTMEQVFAGSVVTGVLHSEINATVFLTPVTGKKEISCPPSVCMVAVDGSKNSMIALQRASVLAKECGDTLEKIVLATVIDLAECSMIFADGNVPDGYDSKIMGEAISILVDAGIDESRIVQAVECGQAADVLVQIAKKHDVDLIFMGRRERNIVQEMFMGSVSNRIIQKCLGQAIVLVTEPE